MNRSIRVFGVVVMLLFVALAAQLANLQVVGAKKLDHNPKNTRQIIADFARARGAIQTSDGVVIAQSVPSNDIYKYQRQYPKGLAYAFTTGFFSFRYGASGAEAQYNGYLSGRNLPLTGGLKQLLTPGPRTGNVTLTLSDYLQQAATFLLGQRVGAVIALDPRDGSVLALVSQPSYDPNELASHNPTIESEAYNSLLKDPLNPMLPRVYRQSYAPGSTFKTVTASAVLDHNPSLATKQYPSTNALTLPQTTNKLHNFGGETCGGQLPTLFTISCDTGFGQVGLDLGAQSLSAEAQAFGFNQVPPLDLPGVFKSTFPPASFFTDQLPLLAFSAIGQSDVSATPLQMALIASAIANHGVIMTPHVLKDVHDSQGALVTSFNPKPWLTATSPSTADQVKAFMVSVVQHGTGTAVQLPGLQVAAKTGTAEVTANATNAWMIAFAPADNPVIAVAVVLPALPGVGNEVTGGVKAAPIVRGLLSAWLQHAHP
jgi:peptidoglycan glycosyltransferase